MKASRLVQLGLVVGSMLVGFAALAATTTTDFTMTINAGNLSTAIRSDATTDVVSPAVAFSSPTVSFSCQAGGSTGTLGSNAQRLYVDNLANTENGWTLTIGATGGSGALWTGDSTTDFMDYNDASGSGCTEADGDTYRGQLTVDPSGATINNDCDGFCGQSGLTLGSLTAFTSGSPVTIATAASGNENTEIGRWYFTGIGLSQTIPAQQHPAAYTLNMTVTVTAS